MRTIIITIILSFVPMPVVEGQPNQGVGIDKVLESATDPQAFLAYQDRLRFRREDALVRRYLLNKGKVHRYWTAIRVPYNPMANMPDPVGVAQERLRRHRERMRTYRYPYIPSAPSNYIPVPNL